MKQEIIIRPDGNLEIPWVVPGASDLLLAVWEDITGEPFPVTLKSGQLYCG